MSKLRDGLVWQDKKKRCVGAHSVIGHFVMWAVRQSPYECPTKLATGIKEFIDNYAASEYHTMSIKQLHVFIDEAIAKSPTIQSWNNPRKGNHTMVFTSRYNTTKPDYDFIDLGALSRNIKHSIWLELMYEAGDK